MNYKRFLGWIIVLVFGFLVFLSVTGLLIGIFDSDYRMAILSGMSLGILLLARNNVILLIRKYLTKK